MAHTIGLVIDQLVYEYHAEFWQGVSEQAVKSGINIVSYVGSTIDYADSMLRTQNKIYDIITEKRVEGAIILTSSVTSHISPDEKRAELRKISSRMPIVCIGDIFDEYPSIGVDNRKGMYDSVEHLIKKHNKRRIAFVGGPSGSTEAQERKAAYMEALTKNGITFDDALFFEGAFVYTSGIEAVQAFVSRKVQFDAVVAASDWMAFGAMQELKHQGFSIPEQIAVSGFDDVESAYVSQPPLSTVRQPVFEMGREAVKTILSIIDGRPYEKRLIYPTEHVIRDSCGCMLSVNVDEHVDQNGKSSNSRADAYHEQHKYLVQRLLKDMENPGSSGFLSMFNSFLERVKRPEELGIYQTLISEIRKEVLSYDRVIQHSGTVVRRKIGRAINTQAKVDKLLKKYCAFINSIEDTLHTARLLLSRKAEQLQFLKYLETKTKTSQIISVGEHLLTTFSKTHLFTTIKNDFPLIDIDTCSIVMYEDPEAQPVSPRSAMIYYYDNSSDRHKDTDPFDTDMIVPDAFWPD
ncbi:MAG: LacI family DNA-binding transcriptional regulator, partial [Spirochaetota bacterium]